MTMHLVPGMTTTSTKRRKPKNKTKSQVEAEVSHNKFLETMGIDPNKKAKSKKEKLTTSYKTTQEDSSINSVAGVATKRKNHVYSGERKLIGIATMHKSNMVPIFEKDDAKEVARMRRD